MWRIKGQSLEDTAKREPIMEAWKRSFQWDPWGKVRVTEKPPKLVVFQYSSSFYAFSLWHFQRYSLSRNPI